MIISSGRKNTLMKKSKTVVSLYKMLVTLIVLFGGTSVFGQTEQIELSPDSTSLVAPHGGVLNRTGDFIIEMVHKGTVVSYYLYDTEIKPISNIGIKANAVFKFPNKSTVLVKLIPQGMNGYYTGKKNISNFISCKTHFSIKKKNITAHFIKPIVNSIKYTCSIHPEIVMDKPGKCPRCGMELVEKKELAKRIATPTSY